MVEWLVGSGVTTVLVVLVLVWGRQRRQASGLKAYERGGDASDVATIMRAPRTTTAW
jgi:hypothetical protein